MTPESELNEPASRASKAPIILLIISLLGAGGLGYTLWRQTKDHAAELEALRAAHVAEVAAKDKEMQEALAAQNEQHQQAITTLNEDFEKRAAAMAGQSTKQLTAALKEFDSIFEGNKEAIGYIDELEKKVKAGKEVSKQEVDRLAVIATALGYLQKQYQKPLQEFSELQNYFERQAQATPEKPQSRFGFFRRTFSRDYREKERDYYREEGMRQAFEQAQGKFGEVYSAAQRSMASVNLNAEAEIKNLQKLMEDKQSANAEDLSSFFDNARKALRTHQEVLKFEPELPASPPRVQP
ncbi:MAG: hypothetical protein KDK97_03150 [Verrucomicrobiales bacterium]|nr:hypothetical protein [Verrucomicrobiales bacterium]MCP5560597.1 hypothetical protein [Verrucomicrobiaceae bacterium]